MKEDDFRRLIELEQAFDDLPAGAEMRIFSRVEAALVGAVGSGGGNDGSGGGGSDGHRGGEPGANPTAEVPRSLSPPPAIASAVSKIVSPWVLRGAYIASGIAVGAGGHAIVSKTPLIPVNQEKTSEPMSRVKHEAQPFSEPETALAPAPENAAMGQPEPAARQDSSPMPTSPAPANARAIAAAPAPSRNSTRKAIAEERSDLDVARAALGRGRITECLAALEEHQRTYGEGSFAEEREVLAVQALVAAGRMAEARERAQRFRRKYPASIFGPALSSSLDAGP